MLDKSLEKQKDQLQKKLDKKFPEPQEMVDRISDNPLGGGRHEMDWVRACKEDPESMTEPCSNFDYAGPLTEMVLMGNLAIRLQGLNQRFGWDGENMEITNIDFEKKISIKEGKVRPKGTHDTLKDYSALESANEWIKHNYREGWKW